MRPSLSKGVRRSVQFGVLASAAALVCGLTDNAAAVQNHPQLTAQSVTETTQQGSRAAASPALSLPPDSDYIDSGAAALAPAMKSVKADLVIHLAAPLAALYVANNDIVNQTGLSVTAVPARQPKCATAADHAIDNFIPVDMYAVSTAPGARPYGQFPPTKISMLAFGSIPVTATVHLSQIVKNGRLQPFQVVQYFPGSSPACDPNWSNEVPQAWNVARGDLNITLSDVAVDRVPLNVGASCRSATPVHLNLWGGPDPEYDYAGGGTLVQKADSTRVNGYLLHPGSTDLTIPPFVGCNSNGDDVSRLITSMISGPGNELRVAQTKTKLGGFDANDPTACYVDATGATVCPEPPPPYPTFP